VHLCSDVGLPRWKKVHSTLIIKNNQTFFLMQLLYAVLKVRYGNHPAGHWVVFQATISDVKVFALAYAWSQHGVSYFLSTCGKTSPQEVKYMSHSEEDFGNVVHKEINRPKVCHFLYAYLPLINENNKQRQNLLNLEQCWRTKDLWMQLLTTTLGMCVVDMHRRYRNKKYEEQLREARGQSIGNKLLAIRKFSDQLCVNLERKQIIRKASARSVWHMPRHGHNEQEALERMATRDGSVTRDPTEKQTSREYRSVGSAIKANCFICRKYLKRDGTVDYQNTSWQCKKCRMPLCKLPSIDKQVGWTETCLTEYQESDHPIIGCSGSYCPSMTFLPKDLQVNLSPQRSNRLSLT
jgi:hypothetical protein